MGSVITSVTAACSKDYFGVPKTRILVRALDRPVSVECVKISLGRMNLLYTGFKAGFSNYFMVTAARLKDYVGVP